MSTIREALSHKARKVPRVRFSLSRILLTVAAACLAVTAATGAASASAPGGQPGFAARARGYGLSSAQVSTLQREVNSFIAEHGGKQAAINEVIWPGGSIVFPVPGHKYAYPVTSAATARPGYVGELCAHGLFCVFQKRLFEGGIERFYYCRLQDNKKRYHASWKNDQTPGTRAELVIPAVGGGSRPYWTHPAWSRDGNFDIPIYSVKPC